MRGLLGYLSAFRNDDVEDRRRPDTNVGVAFLIAAVIVAFVGFRWLGSDAADGSEATNGWALGGNTPSRSDSTTIPASPAAIAVRIGATDPGGASGEMSGADETGAAGAAGPTLPDGTPISPLPGTASTGSGGSTASTGSTGSSAPGATTTAVVTTVESTDPPPTDPTTTEQPTTTADPPTTTEPPSTTEVPPAPSTGEARDVGLVTGLGSVVGAVLGF